MMNFLLKTRKFVLKTRKFVFKMMDLQGKPSFGNHNRRQLQHYHEDTVSTLPPTAT